MDDSRNPNPNDIIQVKLDNGKVLEWRVESILLGGLNQESVVELYPTQQSKSPEGKTLVPSQLLDIALKSSNQINLYRLIK